MVRCDAGRARRMARRPYGLGAVGRDDRGIARPLASMVGVAPRGSPSAHRVGVRRPDRRLAARRCAVLVPDVGSTSTLFRFPRRAGARRLTVTTVPPRLAEAIDAGTDLVAFSAVQMSSGEVADLAAIATAARHHGARTCSMPRRRAAGCRSTRRVGCGRLRWVQVADVAARHGLHGDRDEWRARHPRRRRLVRRETSITATSACHCDWRPTRAASTPRPRGSPGSARSPPSSCSTESASTRTRP